MQACEEEKFIHLDIQQGGVGITPVAVTHVAGFNVFIPRSAEGTNQSIILGTKLLSNGRPLFGFLLHFGEQWYIHHWRKISLFLFYLCFVLNP